METFVVRVWLPDRPGALGQVASRIGAVNGDVVGIDILERGGGNAVDELTVTLPDASAVDRLVHEIRQVEGVAVEDVRPVPAGRPDGGLAALSTAAAVVSAAAPGRLGVVCDGLVELLDAEWAAAISVDAPIALATAGTMPDLEWLVAFLLGSEHLADDLDYATRDLLWSGLRRSGVVLATGRPGRVFHARERDEFRLLAGIVDALT